MSSKIWSSLPFLFCTARDGSFLSSAAPFQHLEPYLPMYYSHNRMDLPVLGTYSAARQILPYIEALALSKAQPYAMKLRGVQISSMSVYESLVTSIANVYRDVLNTGFINYAEHPEEYNLFHNPHHAVDGPCCEFCYLFIHLFIFHWSVPYSLSVP